MRLDQGPLAGQRIKVYTRSMDERLYRRSMSFVPFDVPRERIVGSTALGYLETLIEDESADLVVNVDEDAYISHPERVVELAQTVVEGGYATCGIPDGGAISHRVFNPVTTNPFFNVFNTGLIRTRYEHGCSDGELERPGELEALLPPNLVHERYQWGDHESYDALFLWIRRHFPVLYLTAHEHADGVSTILLDDQGRPFLNHSWYTREYMRDRHHTRRIHALINETHRSNAAGHAVGQIERVTTELRLAEYGLARKAYIRLKTRYGLV